MGFSFSGMMQGAGAGLTNYGQMLHEQEKMDWETQRDNVRWERESHFKRLEAKAARDQHTSDNVFTATQNEKNINAQIQGRHEDTAENNIRALEAVKMQTEASKANASQHAAEMRLSNARLETQAKENSELRRDDYDLRKRTVELAEGKAGEPKKISADDVLKIQKDVNENYVDMEKGDVEYKRLNEAYKKTNGKDLPIEQANIYKKDMLVREGVNSLKSLLNGEQPTGTQEAEAPTPLKGAPTPVKRQAPPEDILNGFIDNKLSSEQVIKSGAISSVPGYQGWMEQKRKENLSRTGAMEIPEKEKNHLNNIFLNKYKENLSESKTKVTKDNNNIAELNRESNKRYGMDFLKLPQDKAEEVKFDVIDR